MGRSLLSNLHAALRALTLYPRENQVTRNALRELVETVAPLLAGEGVLRLRLVGETFFVNDLRLRADLATFGTFAAISRLMQGHGIGAIEVEPGVDEREWTSALAVLQRSAVEAEPFAGAEAALRGSAAHHIRFLPETDAETDPESDEEARAVARRTYTQSVSVARDLMTGTRMGRGVSLRKVKRSVQSIVDQVLANETSIVGMTTLREFDEYTFTHCVNVCIFSVALGKKIGLEKRQLYELGLGALLHDIGKVRMPPEVIDKPGKLSEEEWALIQEHPAEGMLALFRMHGFGEPPLRAMLMAYEHHMKVDLSGYPSVTRPREPTLFSRVVAVADAFDAATSKRSYQSEPWPPDRVLRGMQESPDRGFDSLLVKAFVSMTGIYPVGTVVILDSYELAVVSAASPDHRASHRPVVKIIYDFAGAPMDPPPTVDLAELDPGTGRPRRTIIKSTDPERYGIHVAHFLA